MSRRKNQKHDPKYCYKGEVPKYPNYDKVLIIGTFDYKGIPVLLETFNYMLQYIFCYEGKYYSSCNYIKDVPIFSSDQTEEVRKLLEQQAMASIDLLLNKDNPDVLVEQNERASAIAEVFEKNDPDRPQDKQPQVHRS